MQTSARILVYSAPGSSPELAGQLAARGYATIDTVDRSEALMHLAHDHADVAIVNCDAGTAEALLQDARNLTGRRNLPVIAISDQADDATGDTEIDVVFRPFQDVELFNRLEALSRLVTMQDELCRRAATAAEFGVDVGEDEPLQDNFTEATVLVIADAAADVRHLQDALGRSALLSICDNLADAPLRLMRGDYDAVVLALSDDAAGCLQFCADIRSNPRLFNTPALVLARPDEFDNAEAPYQAGASDVVHRPVAGPHLLYRTLRLVRQHRYRAALQQVFRTCRQVATSDALTGLYNHGYLHAHLERQIEAAHSAGKALSVGVFEIVEMAELNREVGFVAGDRVLRQLGGLIRNLVRLEDLPARFSGHRFAVVMPDTPLKAAAPVLQRLAGVINHTEFAIPTANSAVRVHVRSGSAELAPAEDAVSLLGRARDGIGG